jgi:hypothetical protein
VDKRPQNPFVLSGLEHIHSSQRNRLTTGTRIVISRVLFFPNGTRETRMFLVLCQQRLLHQAVHHPLQPSIPHRVQSPVSSGDVSRRTHAPKTSSALLIYPYTLSRIPGFGLLVGAISHIHRASLEPRRAWTNPRVGLKANNNFG